MGCGIEEGEVFVLENQDLDGSIGVDVGFGLLLGEVYVREIKDGEVEVDRIFRRDWRLQVVVVGFQDCEDVQIGIVVVEVMGGEVDLDVSVVGGGEVLEGVFG